MNEGLIKVEVEAEVASAPCKARKGRRENRIRLHALTLNEGKTWQVRFGLRRPIMERRRLYCMQTASYTVPRISDPKQMDRYQVSSRLHLRSTR